MNADTWTLSSLKGLYLISDDPWGKSTFPQAQSYEPGGKLTFPQAHGSEPGGKSTFPGCHQRWIRVPSGDMRQEFHSKKSSEWFLTTLQKTRKQKKNNFSGASFLACVYELWHMYTYIFRASPDTNCVGWRTYDARFVFLISKIKKQKIKEKMAWEKLSHNWAVMMF